MPNNKYKAFISYNHADEAWAKWFHRQLERYRIPGKLVGQNTSFGVIPKRLQPVFLDREELSSGSDLSAKVKQVLADSGAIPCNDDDDDNNANGTSNGQSGGAVVLN